MVSSENRISSCRRRIEVSHSWTGLVSARRHPSPLARSRMTSSMHLSYHSHRRIITRLIWGSLRACQGPRTRLRLWRCCKPLMNGSIGTPKEKFRCFPPLVLCKLRNKWLQLCRHSLLLKHTCGFEPFQLHACQLQNPLLPGFSSQRSIRPANTRFSDGR